MAIYLETYNSGGVLHQRMTDRRRLCTMRGFGRVDTMNIVGRSVVPWFGVTDRGESA